MYDSLLATESGFFTAGPRPRRRRPERITPACVRRMAARLSLEAMQIDKIARDAAQEVWEEPTQPASLSARLV